MYIYYDGYFIKQSLFAIYTTKKKLNNDRNFITYLVMSQIYQENILDS